MTVGDRKGGGSSELIPFKGKSGSCRSSSRMGRRLSYARLMESPARKWERYSAVGYNPATRQTVMDLTRKKHGFFWFTEIFSSESWAASSWVLTGTNDSTSINCRFDIVEVSYIDHTIFPTHIPLFRKAPFPPSPAAKDQKVSNSDSRCDREGCGDVTCTSVRLIDCGEKFGGFRESGVKKWRENSM